jgi:CRP-like cAMP-binding protein
LKRLLPVLELRTTRRGEVIKRADQAVDYYYFVNRGLISLVKIMQDGRSVEIGVVGIEGFSSPHTLFGLNKAATHAMVQIPGNAFRIRRDDLMRLMAEDALIRNVLKNMPILPIWPLLRPPLAIVFICSTRAVAVGC